MEQVLPPWSRPAWFGEASVWMRDSLNRRGVGDIGAVEAHRIRPWSAVLRVPTEQGMVYFKANIPVQRHEGVLVRELSRHYSDCILEPLAVDPQRAWMLLPDGREVLRNRVRPNRDVAPWREVLPLYAQLQIDSANRLDTWFALGVPDRRLTALPEQYAHLLDFVGRHHTHRPDRLTHEEFHALRTYASEVSLLCEQLAAFQLPATLQHDDLGDHNIFANAGCYRFFDWGDSSVAHPFFSMIKVLESVTRGCELPDDHPEIQRLRDLYWEPFTCFAPRKALAMAHSASVRLGKLSPALTWHAIFSSLSESATLEWHAFFYRSLRDIS